MQEKVSQEKFQQFPSSITQMTSIPQTLSCIAQKQALFICASPTCAENAFVCSDLECKCRNIHENCLLVEPHRLTKKIERKMINSGDIFVKINDIVDKCIDWLSQWREKIQIDLKYYGLTQEEKFYIKSIHDKQYSKINGQIVFPLIQKINIQSTASKVEQAIKEIQTYWKNQLEGFKQIFSGIESIVGSNPQQDFRKIDSKVLTSKQQIRTLKQFFTKKIKSLDLIYRASVHQFDVKKFYEKCSKYQRTIVVVETEFGKKIGGYTPLKWQVKGAQENTEDPSKQSFIFSLTNGDKFQLIDATKAIQYYGQDCGPRFGGISGASDLTIKNRANINTDSYALFNNCYYNQKYRKSDQDSYQKFSGGTTNFFRVKQWQVFHVNFI